MLSQKIMSNLILNLKMIPDFRDIVKSIKVQ